MCGAPSFVRSDNGQEFIDDAVRDWLSVVRAKTAYIEPCSRWENGYCESYKTHLRDQLLNGKLFYSLREAQAVIEEWCKN